MSCDTQSGLYSYNSVLRSVWRLILFSFKYQTFVTFEVFLYNIGKTIELFGDKDIVERCYTRAETTLLKFTELLRYLIVDKSIAKLFLLDATRPFIYSDSSLIFEMISDIIIFNMNVFNRSLSNICISEKIVFEKWESSSILLVVTWIISQKY